MSVVAYVFGCYSSSLVELVSVFVRTRSFAETFDYFLYNIMSNQSNRSLSSCEIAGNDSSMLKSGSPEMSLFSEVICSLSFKEPTAGTSFIVTGLVLTSCERFSINFLATTHKQDVALHFNPRLPQNYIVRNSKISGKWGNEETCSPFSVRFDIVRGHRFSIEFFITDQEFLIGVNGKHYGSYAHRVSFKKINAVEVKGEVKEVAIEQEHRVTYPQVPIENMPTEPQLDDEKSIAVPFFSNIPNGFTKSKTIHIHGRVKLLPHSFTINLQEKPYFWPHPVIPLHINPRFENQNGQHILCRNSWVNGKWTKEERTDLLAKDLSPGGRFEMAIECSFENYIIHLNDRFFAEYKFRCDAAIVDTINIYGDICLNKIWIEEKKFD